jgi:hypothetical protein
VWWRGIRDFGPKLIRIWWFNNVMEIEEVKTGRAESFYRPEPQKLVRVPDFVAQGAPARRSDPFILTDYRGSEAYQKTT